MTEPEPTDSAQTGTHTAPERMVPGATPSSDSDDPVLPTVTRDEQALGWGDEPSERDADWYRRERPPHHE